MGLWNAALDLLYPPKCVFCGALLNDRDTFACNSCKDKLAYTHGAEIKKNGEFFDFCLAPLYYRDEVRDSILEFKFGNKPGRAENYSILLAECISDNIGSDYDIISWVPISKKRFRKRGYDQSKLLAAATAERLGKTAVCTLDKYVDIPAQSGLKDPSRRKANVCDVYRTVSDEIFEGKRILLIDDIITTGATMAECSRTLIMAGAESVVGACLARAD